VEWVSFINRRENGIGKYCKWTENCGDKFSKLTSKKCHFGFKHPLLPLDLMIIFDFHSKRSDFSMFLPKIVK